MFPHHTFEQIVISAHFDLHIIHPSHKVTFKKPILACVELRRGSLFLLCIGSFRCCVTLHYSDVADSGS